jgi:hypothetical protein
VGTGVTEDQLAEIAVVGDEDAAFTVSDVQLDRK